jgi:hypothetical protein
MHMYIIQSQCRALVVHLLYAYLEQITTWVPTDKVFQGVNYTYTENYSVCLNVVHWEMTKMYHVPYNK